MITLLLHRYDIHIPPECVNIICIAYVKQKRIPGTILWNNSWGKNAFGTRMYDVSQTAAITCANILTTILCSGTID